MEVMTNIDVKVFFRSLRSWKAESCESTNVRVSNEAMSLKELAGHLSKDLGVRLTSMSTCGVRLDDESEADTLQSVLRWAKDRQLVVTGHKIRKFLTLSVQLKRCVTYI